MGIHRSHNGKSLFENDCIWIEDHGEVVQNINILEGPRVGVGYSEECSNWPWRFRIKDNHWTSKPDGVEYRY